jgi:hypothetical protein
VDFEKEGIDSHGGGGPDEWSDEFPLAGRYGPGPAG